MQEAKRSVPQTLTQTFLQKGGRRGRGRAFFSLAWQGEAGAVSSSRALEGGCACSETTGSTSTLGHEASSAVLPALGHSVWGSGLRTIYCPPHVPGVRGQVPAPPLPVTAWGLHFAGPQFPVPPPCRSMGEGNTWWWPEEVCSVSLRGPGLPQLGLSFPWEELD